ncbi:hypothetical protein ABB55_13265 [Prosthecomicrobium hirschii]|uniref:Uncharacterized protein n=1 Tax=Prosthecodimorpha hirschii TaxID=665126 RepID=A0A0P6VPA9_9HYPH|nr:hypothetical protein [Prosthecomicrobium hirschii]KPL53067.1 hypothetical protein ABB55_13265 [Prosthecomicrobium hirschii]TPQ49832.1 hypothetical protein C2U72_16505 [Prosthecomicrobium hirschii]
MPKHLAVAITALALVLPAGAAMAAENAFTDLDLKGCAVTDSAPPDGDENGKPEPYAWRCKGYGSWNVFIAEGDLRAGVAFSRARRFEDDYHYFPKFSVTGPKVEWRGPRRGNAIVPEAAIFRYIWSVDGRKGSVLAIARLGRDATDTCVFGYVDAVANPDANALAARVADEEAVRWVCNGNSPKWYGKVGEDFR